MISLDDAARIVSRGEVRPDIWLRRNAELFRGVDLAGKTLIDIGSGAGRTSAYAALMGARRVLSVEPEAAGSRSTMLETAHAIRGDLDLETVIEIIPSTIEKAGITETFDIVLINNTINHINEEACERLDIDPTAKEEYRPLFEELARLTKPGGLLIMTDCSNRNIFGDLGFKSPFAPTINWRIHQPPTLWANLLSEHGFSKPAIAWMPVAHLGWAGRILGRNKFVGYMMNSHFRLNMIR